MSTRCSSASTPARPSSPRPPPYLYSTYEAPFAGTAADEAMPSSANKVIILGGGPNRIGQGIEFDYCCCHACFALADAGYESIMINCNPETVSTDYDTSDRLYFEPLTAEDVLEVVRLEQSAGTLAGIIVQLGGQTPLKLAKALEAAKVPILGTSPDMIDLAEDRDRFQKLIVQLGLKQPENGIAKSAKEARAIADRVGFPVIIRPSYVLGGRAMEIVHDMDALDRYIAEAVVVSGKSPVLIDSYLADAIEVDVDALADGKDVFVCGIMEHIEEAGIHSGDSACSLPPHSLSAAILAELERQTAALALALQVRGLMNVQYAIKGSDIYILEVNPRASRTVPFVAKTRRHPVRQDRRPGDGRRPTGRVQPARRSGSIMSASRKRFSRSPVFPALTPSSGRRCARPAKRWASTATTPSPSPRASSAPEARCPKPVPCSFRSATSTSHESSSRSAGLPASASGSSPPAERNDSLRIRA